jgi:hypothetical protein
MARLRVAALILLAVLVTVMLAVGGNAASRKTAAKAPACPAARQAFPLHAKTAHAKASCGQHVADLQWLLHGGKPYVFKQVKPTFKGRPNGSYGALTKHDVLAMKFRIGYPKLGQCGAKTTLLRDTTTRYFFLILEGRAVRPRCWIALAAERVKGAVRTGATATALKIQQLEVSQLGVHEIPDGSNRGPCISLTCTISGHAYGPYQGSTGAFGAAWCASFAQWALGSVTGHGMPAPLPAYVPSIAAWAQQHNYLAAKPRVGSFSIYLSRDLQLVNAFHIGYVVRVTASGVQTIEGNEGNAVRELWRPFATNRMVYVNVPGVA